MQPEPVSAADTVLAPSDLAKIEELMRLHDEALHHLLEIDGNCKSSEGSVSIHLTNAWDRQDGAKPLQIKGVSIYAYVVGVGPGRSEWFDSVDAALEAVREAHAEAMAIDVEQAKAEEAAFWAALTDGSGS